MPGVTIITDRYFAPADMDKYLAIGSGMARSFAERPECDYCDITVNPEDPGNIRVVHAWSKDKEWYYEVST